MKKLILIVAVLMSFWVNAHSAENDKYIIRDNANFLDVCDFFLESKPIIFYDNMFGEAINAGSIFTQDKRQPCMNYEYTMNDKGQVVSKKIELVFAGIEIDRYYEYNENGRMVKLTEKRKNPNEPKNITQNGNYEKTLCFEYSPKGSLREISEQISLDKFGDLGMDYDKFKYKFDEKGHICQVIGTKDKWMGLSASATVLKVYEYDAMSRLKAIRDFINPNESRIIRYDEFVKKN